MLNIIRRGNGGSIVPSSVTEWDPTRIMRDLFRWDPFREMAPHWPTLAEERMVPAFNPSFDVKETKESFVFRADLPGVKESDIEVSLTGNRLSVNGKREAEKEEKGDTYYTCERSYGAFTRTFTLPEGVDSDHVRAEAKDGVLTLVLPKRPESQPKRITVQPGAKVKS